MRRATASRARGFTLIEVVIATLIVAIVASFAVPSYRAYLVRASRVAAQTELLELAAMQEKILLNSTGYASSVTAAYTGTAAGGLGVGSGRTRDARYALSTVVSGATYTLTATPIDGTSQAGDGALTIDSSGRRGWGGRTW